MFSEMQTYCYAITICILVHPILSVESDYFTSIVGMQKLLGIEENMIDCLIDYISEVQNKLAQLKKYVFVDFILFYIFYITAIIGISIII